MSRVFISIASNIEPEENVRKAVRLLRREMRITGVSTFYRTPAQGRPEQPDFINGVIEAETEAPARVLKFLVLRRIEEALGRRRTEDKYAPRTMDLDLVLYDDIVVDNEGLVLPDPDIGRRPFLALPLAELSPDLLLPGVGTPIGEIAGHMAAVGMQPLDDYTQALRKEIGHEPEEG